jgi:phosphatidylglycerol lysyltransferase
MAHGSPLGARLGAVLRPLIALALFVIALEVLSHELAATSWRAVIGSAKATPWPQIAAAIVLTILNYAVLTGYDFLAFASIGKRLAPWRIGVASFLAYAVANNVGFALVSGASIRYRFYTRWGLGAEELSRIIFSYSITFWLGLLALGGLSLALTPQLPIGTLPVPIVELVGWMLLALSVAFVVYTGIRKTPIQLWRFELSLPRPAIATAQWIVSSADWVLAASVLYVLLLDRGTPFFAVTGAFLTAQLIGLLSHVPGGAGVFEGLIVVLLRPYVSPAELVGPLLLYRGIYYVLPFTIAAVALVLDEAYQRRAHAARTAALIGRLAEQLTPRALSLLMFVAGLVLLFSGATPAAEGRLEWMNQFVPLGIVETSHLAGSLIGVLLLLLSQAVARRLDAAYHVAIIALVAGIAASLLKGVDIEEATLLTVVLLLLSRARPAFDRKAALFETRLSPGTLAAVAAALAASTWLGLFAFKHVEYSDKLWWQFALSAEAPRFLRATVVSAIAVLLIAAAKLLRPAPHEVDAPSQGELDTAAGIIATQAHAAPNLIFLRDKGVLFDASRRGFVMYGVQGRTWAALGDPVGPAELVPGLIRAFLERCDDFGGTPVFYEARKDYLHHYADFGLTFIKLGEEARVDLSAFTLEGGAGHRFRQALRRFEKADVVFRIVPPAGVAGIIPQLRRVSDDWLGHKGAEKGFSLGFFDEEYLSRFPIAVIERQDRILAFANIWTGADRHELSVDLMRYDHDAPSGVMESLFTQLIVWGRDNGYRWFSLGMAPLSGFEHSPVAPLWNRAGTFLYEHGEAVYNFQGLRLFKQKFNPAWEPHYLAYPGGFGLARALTDITLLIAGGYRQVFSGARRR